jgi:hypothetical protein
VIYLRIQVLDQVHLVNAYGKDQNDDVSPDDKKAIRRFVQILTPIRHARSAGRPTRSARRRSSQALEAAMGSVPRFGAENVPTGTAAEELAISENAVIAAKSRVIERLGEESGYPMW